MRLLLLLAFGLLLAACSSQPSTGRPDAAGVGAGNGAGMGAGGAPGSGPILAPIGGKLGPADSSSK